MARSTPSTQWRGGGGGARATLLRPAHSALDVVPGGVREHELHAAQAPERMLERVLVHDQVAELGEDVRLREEAARVDAVMTHEAVQRGAVAHPELVAHAVR